MKFLQTIRENKAIYWLLAAIVGFVFFFQAFSLAHALPSRVDEGSFLIKGYYFITGKYQPFEDFGPWTNNMPLAYWIPGIPQAVFGPGLRTGRYFAIALTAVTLAGIWVLVRRYRGEWWALAAVLALAVNPSWIAVSVQAVSQGTAACLVAWMMVCLFGAKRKPWQLYTAALLSAAATLTRQNMVFLIPFVFLFTWWRFGIREAWKALAFSVIPVIAIHAIYFPKIMNLWYGWLPGAVKRWLDVGMIEGGGTQVWRPDGTLQDRLSSLFIAVRYHFISLLGVLLSLPLLLKKKNWRSENEWKTVISSTILFSVFFFMHAWASLTKNYCIFCFPNYLTFFIPIGLFIAMLGISTIVEKGLPIHPVYLFGLSVILIPGVFFGSVDTVGRELMKIPVPRIKGGTLAGGVTELWELLRNRYGLTYDQLLLAVPPAIGFIIITGFFLLLFIVHRRINKSRKSKFGNFAAISLVCISYFCTPAHLLGNVKVENNCGGDVIQAYESAGKQLQAVIPDDSSVYWGSGSVVTPLLYIADAGIQPLQLNGIYPKRQGGDRNLLEKDGYYNGESLQGWRGSSDFLLVQASIMVDFWKDYLDPALFDEYAPTGPIDPCDPNSAIKIFKRN